MKKNSPWYGLQPNEARRVDSDGKQDFFWVLLERSNPGLMLKLAFDQQEIHPLPNLKHLDVQYRTTEDGKAFVIGLEERTQIELFETLCRDVVAAGEASNEQSAVLGRTVQRTRRWHYLLRGGSRTGLSLEEQQGLVAELAFLRELSEVLGPETAVDAWKGPEGASKDFELTKACVEIKARRSAAKQTVQISSEDQLSDVPSSELFLRVTNVSGALQPNGMTLHDHVCKTEKILRDSQRALEMWDAKILATGYDELHRYDDRKWEIGASRNYEVREGFPRIAPPLLPGVQNVKYSINLDSCSAYEVETELTAKLKAVLKHD